MPDEAITIVSPLKSNGKKIGTVKATDDKQGNATADVQFQIPITKDDAEIGMINVTTNSNGEVVPNVILKCPVSLGDKSEMLEITIDEKGSASTKFNISSLPVTKLGKLF